MPSDLRQHKQFQSKKESKERRYHKRYACACEYFSEPTCERTSEERITEALRRNLVKGETATLQSGGSEEIAFITINGFIQLKSGYKVSPFNVI